VAGNSGGSSSNIFGTFSGVNNLTNGTPLLASLGNYGGPTQTMPPLPGSPAIDAGSDSVTNLFATDQRGFARLAGAHVDIGAVELETVQAYAGNGDTGFGGAIGQGSLTLTDDGTNIFGLLIRGPGNFNDNLVIYLDAGPGGFADTSGFADDADGLRRAISGIEFGTANRSIMTNLPGFLADYAIALGPQSESFGGLWGLASGGANSLNYVTSVNLAPLTNTASSYTFSFPVSAIGLTPGSGATFQLFGTYISSTGYRSDEALPGNVSGIQGWSPFNNTAVTNYTISGMTLMPTPPQLTSVTVSNGTLSFSFTNVTGASFTVFASTNVALPFNAWSNLGPAVETSPGSGQFQFTDPQSTNYTERYYRVKSP